MENVQKYISANSQRYLDELFELIRIPSVSADPVYAGDVARAATWIKDALLKAGADKAVVYETEGHPIVFGEKTVGPDKPTVLIYGHYDVQPADPVDLWDSPPFEPVIKDDKIYARGSCDDKGQLYMHIKAFEAMSQNNALPCNIKFMIEGEEEVGSANLETFCKTHKNQLACDVILISDTSIIANDTPSITTGLRGLTYLEVEVTGPNKDLHSGVYGGAVANPANILCKMIGSLHNSDNYITIPGFYDDVEVVNPEERQEMNKAPFSLDEYKAYLDIDDVHGEEGFTTLERTSIRPTLDVNGIWSGYTGEGSKTVLPSKAFAKISMRLVPNQTDEKILDLFTKHFKAIAPPSVRVEVHPHHGGAPYVTPTDSIAYRAAHKAMEQTFGKPPLPQRSGGSIPIVALFEKVLEVKSVLMGFGLNTDDIHSPNEHYGLFNFYKGIETIPYFYTNYMALRK